MNSGTQLGTAGYRPDDPIANRRKPRMFASENPTVSPSTPYDLEFCIFLQSEGFGINRRFFIESCGGVWLTC